VVLIGDKEYDQGHVIGVLCKAIPGLGAMKALAAFQEAQTSGKAIVIICDEVRGRGGGGSPRGSWEGEAWVVVVVVVVLVMMMMTVLLLLLMLKNLMVL
jgi:hypothetical protein